MWDTVALHATTSIAWHKEYALRVPHWYLSPSNLDLRVLSVSDSENLGDNADQELSNRPEVRSTSYGINADFVGPDLAVGGHLTWDQWNVIVEELPRLNLRANFREKYCNLCRIKP